MAFYGRVIKPGETVRFVPSPGTNEELEISRACLASNAPKDARASLSVRFGAAAEAVVVATLQTEWNDSQLMFLTFNQRIEFSVTGDAAVHVSGQKVGGPAPGPAPARRPVGRTDRVRIRISGEAVRFPQPPRAPKRPAIKPISPGWADLDELLAPDTDSNLDLYRRTRTRPEAEVPSCEAVEFDPMAAG